ncbi:MULTISPECIES: GNAT family N-acetyltransferase [Brevibacillus]|uniref:GNAT family N-acetyltransferase n=1 Tax=Brevibacillus TaxID=55080 RepID=UPI00203B7A46|nr:MULTISPECIES: GNAT family N-acetyltransferase [Brevibacillus]MCM3081809.1 GNAT family N-acetyltransferase [Brevibacillus invocatus]MCM3432197.1 GNAT family N-acetyltransferase [Brevibacillus invocatus]MDH4619642.1 GNAT family N-acetyltransferase [Brevibacillus sp. AY1]
MIIRAYRDSDISQMVALFYETVHTVNAHDYSHEQLQVWAPEDEREMRLAQWSHSFRSHITYVAEIDGLLAGFGDMTHDGYLDRLYVHKDYQGRGIASALIHQLESEANRLGLQQIWTEASITAKPFFERHGYQTIQKQTVERRGVALHNYLMKKRLGSV